MVKEACVVKGACVAKGGMHGEGGVHGRGHVWWGMCGRGHVWQERRPLQCMVHILLECIFVGKAMIKVTLSQVFCPKILGCWGNR